MLLHVHIAYNQQSNPVAKSATLSTLVGFSEWMAQQTQFPDVVPQIVTWSATQPPEAFAFFEAPGIDQMRSYLHGMPEPAIVTIRPVERLADVAEQGVAKLKEAGF